MTQETTNTENTQQNEKSDAWKEIFHLAEDCYDVVNGYIDFNKFYTEGQRLFDVKYKVSD